MFHKVGDGNRVKLWSHLWLFFSSFFFLVGGVGVLDVRDASLAFYWLVLNNDALVAD